RIIIQTTLPRRAPAVKARTRVLILFGYRKKADNVHLLSKYFTRRKLYSSVGVDSLASVFASGAGVSDPTSSPVSCEASFSGVWVGSAEGGAVTSGSFGAAGS